MKTEAETIIGIYLGFQSEIGCGETVLFRDGRFWKLTWYSPTSRTNTPRYAARYQFDSLRLASGNATVPFSPEAWGRILATEVRNKWGGNPTKPGPDAKPIRFIDGLETDGGGE